jgi:hypothetical protein
MESFDRAAAEVRTKRTWILALGAAWIGIGFGPVVGLLPFARHHPALWIPIVLYYAGLFGLLHAWNRFWRVRRGAVRASEEGLRLDGALLVARSAVRHGHVLSRDGAWFVRLGHALSLFEIAVADAEEGRALLESMRLDPDRSVGQYPMMNGTYRQSWLAAGAFFAGMAAMIAVMLLLRAHHPGASLLLLLGALVPAGAWSLGQFVRVAVGADGVRIRRLFRRARFVPFSAIASAERDGRDVTIRLRDGQLIRMHHAAAAKSDGWTPLFYANRADEGAMLVERIEAQLARRSEEAGAVAGLARGAREAGVWVRDVARASDAHASFRAPAIAPDTLWRVVEDATSASTARAGAALALRERLDDGGRLRLRVVADACAEPELRVALEAVVEADEEALEAAFAALEDGGARAR